MTDLPEHIVGAPTWSSMLAAWRGRADPAVVTGTTTCRRLVAEIWMLS